MSFIRSGNVFLKKTLSLLTAITFLSTSTGVADTARRDIVVASARIGSPANTGLESEFLAPLSRAAAAADFLAEPESEGKAALSELSEDLSLVGEAEAFEDNVTELVDRWVMKQTEGYLSRIKVYLDRHYGQTAHSIWETFAKDRALRREVVDTYLNKIWKDLSKVEPIARNLLIGENGEVLSGEEKYVRIYENLKPRVVREFVRRFAGADPYSDTDTKREDDRPGTPGVNAVSLRAGETLSEESAREYDKEVLAAGFKNRKVTSEFRNSQGERISENEKKYNSMRVMIHDGLDERIAEGNLVRYRKGERLIPFSRAHPGTWHGRGNRLHKSKYLWANINENDARTEVLHETVHLDLYHHALGEERKHLRSDYYDIIIPVWEKYIEYCENKKIPLNEEDFVDRLREWVTELGNPAGVTAKEYPDTDTRRIRQKMARLQSARIERWGILNKRNLLSGLLQAYELAAISGENNALCRLLDHAAKNNARDEVVQLGKFTPLWARKDLTHGILDNTEKYLEKLFEELLEGVGMPKVSAVIMAGGGGERVWPQSTPDDPKQITEGLIDEALLKMAIERVKNDIGKDNVFIQTSAALRDKIVALVAPLGIKPEQVFAEPTAADTSGAVGYAAARLSRMGRGEDVMFICTADHYIDIAESRFKNTYMTAAKLASVAPLLGTIGIDPEPIGASEEYGCVNKGGDTFMNDGRVVKAERFEEKPKGERAREIFNDRDAAGKHKWNYNSGMFIARASTMLMTLNEVAPFYGERFNRLAQENSTAKDEEEVFRELAAAKKQKKFPHSAEPSGFRKGVSFDFAVAVPVSSGESHRVGMFMVESDWTWMDIGGFKAVHEYRKTILGAVDEKNNVSKVATGSSVETINCADCLVQTSAGNVDIHAENLENTLVWYNPANRVLLVAPVDVSGDTIKALYAEVSRDPRYKSFASKYDPADHAARREASLQIFDAQENRVTVLEGNAQGLIFGSTVNTFVHANTGFAVAADMMVTDGSQLRVSLTEGEDGRISIDVRRDLNPISSASDIMADYGNSEKAVRIAGENPYNASNRRMDEAITLLKTGDVTFSELGNDGSGYAYLYGINIEDAASELSELKRWLAIELITGNDGILRKAQEKVNLDQAEKDKSYNYALDGITRWLSEKEFADYQPALTELIFKAARFADHHDISEEQANMIIAELYDSFRTTTVFGTGGRRGMFGIGTNRMNPYMAALTVQGHADYLVNSRKDRGLSIEGCAAAGVWDPRMFLDYYKPNPLYIGAIKELCPVLYEFSSEEMSKLTAIVYAGNGIMYIHPTAMRPTPQASMIVNRWEDIRKKIEQIELTPKQRNVLNKMNAVIAAIVLSSSHNPRDNDGTKFYEESGAQAPPQKVQKLMDAGKKTKVIKYGGAGLFENSELARQYIEESASPGQVAPAKERLEAAYLKAIEQEMVLELDIKSLNAFDEVYIERCIEEAKSVYSPEEWERGRSNAEQIKVLVHALGGTGAVNVPGVVKGMGAEAITPPHEQLPEFLRKGDPNFTDAYNGAPNPESEKSFNKLFELGLIRTLRSIFGEDGIGELKGHTRILRLIGEDRSSEGIEYQKFEAMLEEGTDRDMADQLIELFQKETGEALRGIVVELNDGNRALIEDFSRTNSLGVLTDPDADRVGMGMLEIKPQAKNSETRLNWVSANDNDEAGIVLFTYRLEKILEMANDGRLMEYLKARRDYINKKREAENSRRIEEGKPPINLQEGDEYEIVMVNTVVSNPLETAIAEKIGQEINKLTGGKVTVKTITHHVGFKFTGEIIDNINMREFNGITGLLMEEKDVDLDKAVFNMSFEEGEGGVLGSEGSMDKCSGVVTASLLALAAELRGGKALDGNMVYTMDEYLAYVYSKYGFSKIQLEPIVMTGEDGTVMINDNIMRKLRGEIPYISVENPYLFGKYSMTRGYDHYTLIKEAYKRAVKEYGSDISDWPQNLRDTVGFAEPGVDPADWPDAVREAVNILVFSGTDEAGNKVEIVIRPSGTEPKIKAVVSVVAPPKTEKETIEDYMRRVNGHNRDILDEVMLRMYELSEVSYDTKPALKQAAGDAVKNSYGIADLEGKEDLRKELLLIFPINVTTQAKFEVYFPLVDWINALSKELSGKSGAEYRTAYSEKRDIIKELIKQFGGNGILNVKDAVLHNLKGQIPNRELLIRTHLWFGDESASVYKEKLGLEDEDGIVITAGTTEVKESTKAYTVGRHSVAPTRSFAPGLASKLASGSSVPATMTVNHGGIGYTWGEPIYESRILEMLGYDLAAFKRVNDGKAAESDRLYVEKALRELGIPSVFRETAEGEKVPMEIGELLTDTIFLNAESQFVSLVPAVFGGAHTSVYGPDTGFTGKILSSGRTLSGQIHDFDEYFEVLDAMPGAYAYIGINKDLAQKLTPEEFIEKLISGDTSICNKVELTPGDVYKIPAGMPHGYGPGLLLRELKNCPVYGDKGRTFSTTDRLWWDDVREGDPLYDNVRKGRLLLDDIAQGRNVEENTDKLIALGLMRPRDKRKDVLTQSADESLRIARMIDGYGFLTPVDPETLRSRAVRQESESNVAGPEVLKIVEDENFVWERIVMKESQALSFPRDEALFLFVKEGDSGKLKVGTQETPLNSVSGIFIPAVPGNEISIEYGESAGSPLVIEVIRRPGVTGEVKALARDVPVRQDEKTLPSTAHSAIIEAADVSPTESITSVDISRIDTEAGARIGVSEKITVNGDTSFDELVNKAPYAALSYAHGEVQVVAVDAKGARQVLGTIDNANKSVYVGSVMSDNDGLKHVVFSDGKSYKLEKDETIRLVKTGKGAGVLLADYPRSDAEKLVYAAFGAVFGNLAAISEGEIDIVLESERFAKGGRSVEGSRSHMENLINSFVREHTGKDNLVKFHTVPMAERIDLNSIPIRDGARVIVGVTEDRMTDELADAIKKNGNACTLPMPGIAEPGKEDTFFTLELIATGMLQAGLTFDQVHSKAGLSRDFQALVSQWVQRSVKQEELYLFLPHGEMEKGYDAISGLLGLQDASQVTIIGCLKHLVKYLKPIQPLIEALKKEIQNRRKVLWSA
ncbi:MAG: sugar phosphate nucleotidyltransferase [Candidatus Omnitrophota bacterium]